MKIHRLTDPPPGLTFVPALVEAVEITERGTSRLRLRIGAVAATLEVEYVVLGDLAAPGDIINVSLWAQL